MRIISLFYYKLQVFPIGEALFWALCLYALQEAGDFSFPLYGWERESWVEK